VIRLPAYSLQRKSSLLKLLFRCHVEKWQKANNRVVGCHALNGFPILKEKLEMDVINV